MFLHHVESPFVASPPREAKRQTVTEKDRRGVARPPQPSRYCRLPCIPVAGRSRPPLSSGKSVLILPSEKGTLLGTPISARAAVGDSSTPQLSRSSCPRGT